ncbi:pathogenesis-related protein sth-2 [Phtheirospermum japonicum]|uniref:Pathogenesis-related protein sth-2 n=1 Tax=Phtheirospermum japonicum TaxID=374723 RepID=A0A830BPX9_9LAMI|nr:pathogenesis-related protein sth-2 [Phtheirospermum japonicum]GFQ08089.1 pathogenesis-related protein sth-2 [Phtheirospermum japonicum]
MGIFKHTQEVKLRVAAKSMFKALVTDMDSIPLPAAIKSIDTLQGDGTSTGTIRRTNFADDVTGGYVKHKIEVVDTENYVSKHTLIEGPMIGDKIESIHYDSKFEHSSDGGCVAKIASEYHTKGDIQLNDEEIKATGDQVLVFYKLTEEYLLAHPDVCA